ncbi:MAG: ATP-binding protein [Acidobacteriota bacterium]
MTPSSHEERSGALDTAEPVTLELGADSGRAPFEIELRFASSLPMVSVVGPVINQLSKLAGLDPSAAHEIELCAVEAVTNSIEHGCDLCAEHEVNVGFRTEADRLEIRIFDTAPPADLDISTRPSGQGGERDVVPDLGAFRGRGLFIMKQLMESVTFESSDEGPWHNKLTMERPLRSQTET